MERVEALEKRRRDLPQRRPTADSTAAVNPWIVVGGGLAAVLIAYAAYNNLPDLIRYVKISRM